jgi:hypothetical protein
VTEDQALTWRISTFSGTGADCVEMADTGTGIAIRNSNHRADGTIIVSSAALGALLASVKAGEQGDLDTTD